MENKKKILIVIDVQNDFVTGSLGTPEAQAVVPNIVKKVEEYRSRDDVIIFTTDTHYDDYLETPEGKKLPVSHCIVGTSGYEIIPELNVELSTMEKIYPKNTFGYRWNISHWICCYVYYDENGELRCRDGYDSFVYDGALKTVFKDGEMCYVETFKKIRNRLNGGN